MTGLKTGETVLTIASQANPDVTVKYTVLVYQPVSRITLTASEKSVAAGESIALTPAFTPEDATLKAVTWSSANEEIATVDENGMITAVKPGDTYVEVVTLDGSNRKARLKIRVLQHVTGVHMKRETAYIDVSASNNTTAIGMPEFPDRRKNPEET